MSGSGSKATVNSIAASPEPVSSPPPGEVSRDLDGIRLVLDGREYFLNLHTTGDDYLYIRMNSVVQIEKDKLPIADPALYEHANLVVRLRVDGQKLPDRDIRALPRTHYQTLLAVALQLDNEESGTSADFLSIAFSIFPQFQSILDQYLPETDDGSSASTDVPIG